MNIQKIASFSDGSLGGNPAGVVLCDAMPSPNVMQSLAAEVGFSETVFARPLAPDAPFENWQARYFSPESEVPFCGHATIALGAALALQHGNGEFALTLNDAQITVTGEKVGDTLKAALQSPPTQSRAAPSNITAHALALFGYSRENLAGTLPPALAHAGANHLILALNNRSTLAKMQYDLDAGRAFMRTHNLVTIALIHAETPTTFHAHNAFASGGVLEDPATGAAAAALGGYLRDINWPHHGQIDIIQGEDMGMRSLLHADISDVPGSSIRISGMARIIGH
ncbi:MAG TPA: PhzF family phenazine biosynthesis protein [Hellea balneolensis]|uniref:PhzF family phenazine biosynthesis protein n=1 Tax=Hellea balneolensis TaxID=287478 RepID=A0A7C3FZ17_9PROT|nr:PhzF family phenazine biosynthesis protein [Hellea balneolensis]